MPKLRKMLGDMESGECVSLMRLIETQSKMTLAAWAIRYARDHYLGIYESEYPDDLRMREIISVCEDYIEGNKKLSDIKPVIKEAVQRSHAAYQITRQDRRRQGRFPQRVPRFRRRLTASDFSFTGQPQLPTVRPDLPNLRKSMTVWPRLNCRKLTNHCRVRPFRMNPNL